MFSSYVRYPRSIVLLHWLTLLLLIAVYASMELRGMFPRGSDAREAIKSLHYFLGIGVFALTWLRLALRLTSLAPPISPTPPAWQALLARVVTASLYGLLLAMPVLGYLILNAAGTAPALGGWELPRLIGEQPDLADRLEQWHETIAVAGYWLIGLHTLAALYHHHIRHDNTLLRMSPRRR